MKNISYYIRRGIRLVSHTVVLSSIFAAPQQFHAADLFYSVEDFEEDALGEKPNVSDASYTPGSNSAINGVVVVNASSTPTANPLSGQSLYVYDLGTSSGNSTHFRYPFNGEVDVSEVRVDFDFQRGYSVAAPEGDTGIHVAVGRSNAGALNNSDFRPFRLSLFNDGTLSIDHLGGTTALGNYDIVNPNNVSLLVNSHDSQSIDYDLDILGSGTIIPNTVHVFLNDAKLGEFDFFVTPDPTNAPQVIFDQENNDLGQIAFFQDTNSEGGIAFDNIIVRSVNSVIEAINAPSDLALDSVGTTSATISWVDNSDNETSFIVERSEKEDGPYETIETLDADSTSFVDYGLDSMATYFYRVTAFNGFYSDASIPLEVTTLEQIEPIIVDTVSPGSALANTTVNLGVTVIGRDPISYQWYAGESGDVSNPVSGEMSPTLVASVLLDDVSFWVRATNAEASVDSETFVVQVNEATVTIVYREADLNDVFETAVPGDEIVIADGTYEDFGMNINASGTENARIIVRAETPGGVILKGKSFIRFGGDYITASGFQFYNGDDYDREIGSSVVQFRANNGNVHAHHCRLTECSIIDMNSWEQDVDDDDEDGDSEEFIFHNSKWIQLYGTNHRVDHCYFAVKKVRGALLLTELIPQDGEDGTPYEEYNHRIDHNYFGPNPVGFSDNEFETLRLGTSDYASFNGNMVVEDNFFYHCDGEIEVISNKSSNNTYRNNTMIGCQGSLVIRHGDGCTVEGNVIMGEGISQTGGIRLNGDGHTVVNNYVSGIRGTGLRAGLVLRSAGGVAGEDENGGYDQVRNALIAFNTWYDVTQSWNLGEEGSKDNSYEPTLSTIANNLVVSSSGTLVTIGNEPTQMTYEGNILYGSTLGISGDGFIEVDPNLVEGEFGIFRPSAESAALGASAGSYSSVPFDIDGEVRPSLAADVGADQVSSLGSPLAPMSSSDVGPAWMHALQSIKIVDIVNTGGETLTVTFVQNGASSPSAFVIEMTADLESADWQAVTSTIEESDGVGRFKATLTVPENGQYFWRVSNNF